MRQADREQLWARAGDLGRATLIAAAIGAPLRRRDLNASFDAVTAILACSAVSKTVKAFWHAPRPNGEDDDSFPSQHAAECFAAAVSFGRGAAPGVRPAAIGAAAAVALTRVFARKHYPAGVIAGAALGITAGSLPLRA